MKTLLLIDANSLIHRAFHALPPLTAKGGKPIQAIYGISSILLRVWREEKPDYAAALFDRPEPTFRKKEYAEYKAQRPPVPQSLISQIIEAHNLFSSFGIKTFEKPGFEADDLIATLAVKFSSLPNVKIIILTGDMDTLQLVKNEKIVLKNLKKGVSETVIYDEKAVKEHYGLLPKQMIDYKALVGDPSDNIKGVPGIGPKTAVELLRKFGNLEEIYKNLENAKSQEKLAEFKKEAEFSKKMVTLKKNVDLEIKDIEEIAIPEENEKSIINYFENFGFKTLIKRLRQTDSINTVPKSSPAAPQKKKPAQNSLF